jgi:cytochrome c biogenesis protein CcmG, thiol:disulfide interchange protein DsbE
MIQKRFGYAALPLLVFAALSGVFWKGLSGDPQRLPSTLIGKPVPQFALGSIAGSDILPLADTDLMQGRVTLVNIFASWCGPCREEHAWLLELSKRSDIDVVGINNKDDPENARRFLGVLGNPYKRVGADSDGRTTIDWGGYGVPETFVVDGKGYIRHKIIGAISQATLAELNAEIDKAKRQPTAE